MTVTPFSDLDAPLLARPTLPASDAMPEPNPRGFARILARAFGVASEALARADTAERAFESGRGGLQEMTLERAQADIALSIASAATSRVTQSLQTILGMQV